MKTNKTIGIIIIGLVYLVAIAAGVGVYFLLPFRQTQLLLTFGIIDVVTTLVVFIFSLIFKNASIYDPYWSVAPSILLPAFMILGNWQNVFSWIVVGLVWIWSFRLTLNWMINFRNLGTQDWRYQMLKEKYPKMYFFVNLFGIHMFPTIMVFIGLLPAFFAMEKTASVVPTFGYIIACLVIIVAIVIETIADLQMLKFRKTNTDTKRIMNLGLWKVSRHPNYLGEIMFWIGLYLVFASFFGGELGSNIALLLGTAASPILIFVMFVMISIPMLEKRMKGRKSNYQEYINNTNMLLIFPSRTPINKK